MGYDFYLKLDGIDGECTDSKHTKWIEVLSYSTGVEQRGTVHSAGGQSTSGRADPTHLTVRIPHIAPDEAAHCSWSPCS